MLQRVDHYRERAFITRERRFIPSVRACKLRPNGQRGNYRKNKKNQCRPDGARARRRWGRDLDERREMHFQDFDWNPGVTVATVVVNAHRDWRLRTKRMVRQTEGQDSPWLRLRLPCGERLELFAGLESN